MSIASGCNGYTGRSLAFIASCAFCHWSGCCAFHSSSALSRYTIPTHPLMVGSQACADQGLTPFSIAAITQRMPSGARIMRLLAKLPLHFASFSITASLLLLLGSKYEREDASARRDGLHLGHNPQKAAPSRTSALVLVCHSTRKTRSASAIHRRCEVELLVG